MNRRMLLATGLLVLVLVTGSVGCGGEEATPAPEGETTPTPEPITLTMVSSTKPDGAAAHAYRLFADLVEEYSGGRVTVDIYPNSQLYPVTEQWEAVVTGTVDMLADASYWIYQYVPDVMVFYVDGVWEGREHCYAGAKGVPLALEEVSIGFMQGVLDAVQITADMIDALRLYDTGQHVLWRISMFPNLVLIMNRDSWDSLSVDVQDMIINRIMPQVYEFDKQKYREIEEAAVETIAQNVKTVNWVTQQDLDTYSEYARTHPVYQMQMLMVDPRIIEIVDETRPE